jgi:hypothetical protein
MLDPVDLHLDDAERHFGRLEILPRGGEIGAEIEQFVLDDGQPPPLPFVRHRQYGQPDRAVGFVDVADRGEKRVGLGAAGAVGEAGRAGIAGAGVDLVEPDQGSALSAGDEQQQDD